MSIALSGLKATHQRRMAGINKTAAAKAVARRQFKANKRASKKWNKGNHGAALQNLKKMHAKTMSRIAGF